MATETVVAPCLLDQESLVVLWRSHPPGDDTHPSTVILSLPSLFSLPTDLPTTYFPHTPIGPVVWEQGCGVCSHSVGIGTQTEGSFNGTYWEGLEALSVSLEFTIEAGTVW